MFHFQVGNESCGGGGNALSYKCGRSRMSSIAKRPCLSRIPHEETWMHHIAPERPDVVRVTLAERAKVAIISPLQQELSSTGIMRERR